MLDRRGLGAYGAVYRAVDARSPSSLVALKLALHPGDARFARERELLSRIRHPNVPRLLDHGEWPLADFRFPYLVMEWVDGASLYDWALEQRPTSRQVLHALASLARALAATHAAGGLHRDVKGDNIRVRAADGRVFLTDFGSGHFMGAATLTQSPFPPGTPAYRSPEAWRSVRIPMREPILPYAPTASDDVFALGVTAWRLLTGEYPPPDPALRASPLDEAGPPFPRALNPRCTEALSDLTVRMLSPNPEARGTARDLAAALEQAAREAGPEADVPLFDREEPVPAVALVRSGRTRAAPHVRARAVRPWLAAASLGAALVLGGVWMRGAHSGVETGEMHASGPEEMRDGGTVAAGDAALTAPLPLSRAPFAWATISVDLPPRPFPGQRRPDASGRCPSKKHFPINGGCWIKAEGDLKNCEAEGYYIYKGGCYVPVIPPARPPTSSPVERTEDPPW
ncbi:serine/threonine-protein kinase [Myxococcus sp. RHSTA-1-4]|uniref:serine/threonine-protein kinase n=1 Tax=Myxococcus sp. RHSTA-1-4 TaxID=2874601 RepID=UPI00351DA3C5